MYDRLEAVAKERGFDYEMLLAAIGKNTVRELMETFGMTQEEIVEINRQLHGCMNIL